MKKEIVFFPYKASMWDSLESVWLAAKEDPQCDVYVVPIPYYKKNPDKSFGEMVYEGEDFPEYVPITSYKEYDESIRKPDVAYIHNPYDDGNYVTSVDPRFYSHKLKESVKCLVYIPYYATAGGMGESFAMLPAYNHADYIIVQAPKYKGFIDNKVPREKILALGSPKFDRVIRLCQNPPRPPKDWEEQIKGKTVYFYNTSLAGMLYDTQSFLMKMNYVFASFNRREDVCLIWRPHPLLESTMEAVRPGYKPIFDKLKQTYIDYKIGIYDDTADMEKTIALSDVYIGDTGTSVTSIFGIVGKPIFVLNNFITEIPSEDDDYKAQMIGSGVYIDYGEWLITRNNELYHSEKKKYTYEHYCSLAKYGSGNYYGRVLSVGEKIYVCPYNAQDILVISNNAIEKCIYIDRRLETPGAFCGAVSVGQYIFLIPNNYGAVVRYDTVNDKVDYITEYVSLINANIEGEKYIGGWCVRNNCLFVGSPYSDYFIIIEADSMKVRLERTGVDRENGCLGLAIYNDDIWILPRYGTKILRWNPDNGSTKGYECNINGFECIHRPLGKITNRRPFSSISFVGNKAYVAPFWGNMFFEIDIETGKICEWIPPFPIYGEGINSYHYSTYVGMFGKILCEDGKLIFYSEPERMIYEIDVLNSTYEKRNINISYDVLKAHVKGFSKDSDWMQYCCNEDAFNTLPDFLNGKIIGNPFDKEKQLDAFKNIATNNDGTAGEKIHEFVMGRI